MRIERTEFRVATTDATDLIDLTPELVSFLDECAIASGWALVFVPGSTGAVTTIFFVTWSTPDRAWQEEHLGAVVLTGSTLGDYTAWVESLAPAQAKAWEDAVEALEPGPEFRAGLKAIRVTPRDPEEEGMKSEEGARLILKALGEAGK